VRRLDGLGRRDGAKRIGDKAALMARMQGRGIPIPESWVIETRWFEEITERALPRKHDLRSLIKLSGSAHGEERCARAYEEILAASLPEELVRAVEAWWHTLDPHATRGIAVRPSLLAGADHAGVTGRHLHTTIVVDGLDGVLSAIRSVWATAVLPCSVAAYAEAELREISLAVLLQRAAPIDIEAWLTRTTGARGVAAQESWHLGRLDGASSAQRALVLAPLAIGKGGGAVPSALAPLYRALEPSGFELTMQMGAAALEELGPTAMVCFAVELGEPARLQLLSIDDSRRWRAKEGSEATAWMEVLLASDGSAPPSRLAQSLLARVVTSAAESGLRSVGCKLDDERELVQAYGGRTYFSLSAACRATRDLPIAAPDEVLRATGTASANLLEWIAGRAGAHHKSRMREAMIGSSLLRRQLGLGREASDLERELQREARALAELDLGLLPTDGMSTTLSAAARLVERTAELWAEIAAAQLAHQIALRAIVRRRVAEAHVLIGANAMSGVGSSFGASLVLGLARVVDVFRGDDAACARLRAGITSARDLPDGPARGALGQFLASFGDVVTSPFDPARPRWREDPREVVAMIMLWLGRDEAGRVAVESAQERVRALADSELARYEPELSRAERSAVRMLVDRGRAMARSRAAIDRLLYRVLAIVRHVARDIDRRLRRIDVSCPEGGAFECSLERLAGSFKSGRPELLRIIKMRRAERALQDAEPVPPLSFVGSPPRIGTPLPAPVDALRGIGVSPGVIDGSAIIATNDLPSRVHRDDILVVPSLDLALAPLYFLAGAVASEAGGVLSPGAEALRELAVPAVASLEDARLVLARGERLRLDGEHGTLQRLDAERAVPHAP
jgi:pyruvate,water dikinase